MLQNSDKENLVLQHFLIRRVRKTQNIFLWRRKIQMERWVLLQKGADYRRIAEKYHISPRLACLIRNRNIVGDEEMNMYLNGSLEELNDGLLMRDMDKAAQILLEKIREGSKIRVIGDYDIDGINASYILMKGLKTLGADVDTDIPDRMKDGYGLNKNLIDRAMEDGVDTIVTCDNGIAAAGEIAYGKELGMTLIVTDHHEVPYEEGQKKTYILPPADAVVDPKRADCEYPFKGLCGAAVAYKLIEVLMNITGNDTKEIEYLIENVAIATVGDVMDLIGENRVFVKYGLEMLKKTKNLGLQALMECTQIDKDRLSAYHIGFVLGPCLNASGRLDTAKRALEMLSAETKKEADILAGDLKALNDSRKEMTLQAVEEAIEKIEGSSLKEDTVLVVYLPNCHESLAGIVAGRIRERYYKPTFVLTKAEEGVKGSGRSIDAYHMYEKLNQCKNLLTKFGGHKLAAGLSLKEENIEKLRTRLNECAGLSVEDLMEKVSIDMQMPFFSATEELVEELELLEPFGKGNAKPLFAERNVEILGAHIIGKNKNVVKFQLKDQNQTTIEGIYFGDVEKLYSYMEETFGKTRTEEAFRGRISGIAMSFTYYPQINEYMGRKNVQIVIKNYR